MSKFRLKWLVIGDNWAKHSSTTQHIARQLMLTDHLTWVNSIGMRSPTFALADFQKIIKRLTSTGKSASKCDAICPASIINPMIVPWHKSSVARQLNKQLLSHAIPATHYDIVLSSSPVIAYYLDTLRYDTLVYLRLDDYSLYPSVDSQLIHDTEPQMFNAAHHIITTAEQLIPSPLDLAQKTITILQGINAEHFSFMPLEHNTKTVIGFFGTLDEWLDYDLIQTCAKAFPDIQFEFIGPIISLPDPIRSLKNILIRGPVDYEVLPNTISHWHGAWIPFVINEFTHAIQPLKAREYLSCGLPTFSTPLKEIVNKIPSICVGSTMADFTSWLSTSVKHDSSEQRMMRRNSVKATTWDQTATLIRNTVRQID